MKLILHIWLVKYKCRGKWHKSLCQFWVSRRLPLALCVSFSTWCIHTTNAGSNSTINRHHYLRSYSLFKYCAETNNITVLPHYLFDLESFSVMWNVHYIFSQDIHIYFMHYLHTTYIPTTAQINKIMSFNIYSCSRHLFLLHPTHSNTAFNRPLMYI